jgi:PhnB protein
MTSFAPAGWHSVTSRLFVADPDALIAFLTTVFDATGEHAAGAPAEMRIGDSIVMVSDGGELRSPTSSCLYVYVEDADATFARAVAAGAEVIEAPLDTHYGDRRAMVRDHWGNDWQIATRLEAADGS